MLFDYNFKYYNYRLVLYMVALSVIGILVVASASGQDSSTVTKQIIGIMVGFTLAIGLSIIDYHRIINLYALDYAVCILLLGAVLVMGHTAGGATRWIDVPGIGRIQPSEFVKIEMCIRDRPFSRGINQRAVQDVCFRRRDARIPYSLY